MQTGGMANTTHHVTDDLLAKEVADLDAGSTILAGNVDGEVSVHHAHLVLEALGHANDHVLDVGGDGADGGEGLAVAEPELGAHEAAVLEHLEVKAGVAQIALELTAGTGNGGDTVLDDDGD